MAATCLLAWPALAHGENLPSLLFWSCVAPQAVFMASWFLVCKHPLRVRSLSLMAASLGVFAGWWLNGAAWRGSYPTLSLLLIAIATVLPAISFVAAFRTFRHRAPSPHDQASIEPGA